MINELTVKTYQKELGELLEAFAAKHGLSKGHQRITYNDATFKFTVEFGDKNTVGDTNPVFYKECARFGFRYGLDVKQIGQTIKTLKGPMKFVGLKGKYAIVEDADKKLWKKDPIMVAALLKEATK